MDAVLVRQVIDVHAIPPGDLAQGVAWPHDIVPMSAVMPTAATAIIITGLTVIATTEAAIVVIVARLLVDIAATTAIVVVGLMIAAIIAATAAVVVGLVIVTAIMAATTAVVVGLMIPMIVAAATTIVVGLVIPMIVAAAAAIVVRLMIPAIPIGNVDLLTHVDGAGVIDAIVLGQHPETYPIPLSDLAQGVPRPDNIAGAATRIAVTIAVIAADRRGLGSGGQCC